ncbi:hypothetical protein AVEN_53392-1 [Araneus ventricosus]|uniref:Uncharacterized protein n=1 Tax=Araneus ventricosus TaxID=182803 RepID=A0A4Y2AA03_ARAVE|nr:hypothetical protein AVEN_53392-1 [Araneus ventricosus]
MATFEQRAESDFDKNFLSAPLLLNWGRSVHPFRWVIQEGSKKHYRSLRSPPTPPSAFKTRPPPHFPSPWVVFAFVREARCPSRGSYFSFMNECAKWKTNNVGFPHFSTTTVELSSDIRIDNGFGDETLQITVSS